MTSPRARIYQEKSPQTEPTPEELETSSVQVGAPLDPRFLSNKNIPIDPKVEEARKKKYEDEVSKWAETSDDFDNDWYFD